MVCRKSDLDEISGKCLVLSYGKDLALEVSKKLPEDLSNYIVTYVFCIEENSKRSLYVVSGSGIVKCIGKDVDEVFRRLVFPDKQSLLSKRKESSRSLENVVGRC